MWIYDQLSGGLSQDGQRVATGYSGFGPGKNNPDMENVPDVGPIPRGVYDIGPMHDTTTHGPHVMALTPEPGTDTLGRDGFLIHGDSVERVPWHRPARHNGILPNMKSQAEFLELIKTDSCWSCHQRQGSEIESAFVPVTGYRFARRWRAFSNSVCGPQRTGQKRKNRTHRVIWSEIPAALA